MEKQIKKSYAVYAAWNVDKEEMALDQQSRNGWQLIKGGCFHTAYQKDTTCQYRHKIDYNPDAIGSKTEKERYVGFFESQGWECINSTYNGWNYFKKKYDPTLPAGEYEIYSDQASYNEMVTRWLRLGRALQFMEGILGLVCLYDVIFARQYSDILPVILAAAIVVWLQCGMQKMKERMNK